MLEIIIIYFQFDIIFNNLTLKLTNILFKFITSTTMEPTITIKPVDSDENKPRRKYMLINNEMREKLVSLIVNEGFKIVAAAELIGINYENAKAIYRIYRNDGRVSKKKKYLSKKVSMDEPIERNELSVPKFEA